MSAFLGNLLHGDLDALSCPILFLPFKVIIQNKLVFGRELRDLKREVCWDPGIQPIAPIKDLGISAGWRARENYRLFPCL